MKDLLLITPPFTQLNTPYPATAYIKGFLNTKNITSHQIDLGLEVILNLFSQKGLEDVFKTYIKQNKESPTKDQLRIFTLRESYTSIVDHVILFLQGNNLNLARQICSGYYLPQGPRFDNIADIEWAFGTMGIQDRAKYLATLFIEDIADFIKTTIDPYFGFSRYAEKLSISANSFDELYNEILKTPTYVDEITLEILEANINAINPKLICLSIPFPGNLYSGLKCGHFIKSKFPNIKIALGGGYANTELRSLNDVRVFDFVDYISLDDGELPLELIAQEVLNASIANPKESFLKRTFTKENGSVYYNNLSLRSDYKQKDIGTPDYSDFKLNKYISVIEVTNPMHSLWSDGRWNKLTMAHGCYWGKCTFCDISLDYIKSYEPIAASELADRMETIINQTGENGFHFVDEAAPPSLMQALALEILKRDLKVSWWTNIRFEKRFSHNLCKLLQQSGCIAVSGGLEVASDRLLKLIDKGVTVEQVAQVCHNFNTNGIMVHAYLMYGYPTQTVQETIDSLEMVKQLFEEDVLRSAFWHQFALTAHSPIGLTPEKFGIIPQKNEITFADNEIAFEDKTGIDHAQFSYGLKKSLFNYMHGIGFDFELQDWFDFKIPNTKISSNYIEKCILNKTYPEIKPTTKVIWLGQIDMSLFQKATPQAAKQIEITFYNKQKTINLILEKKHATWLVKTLPTLSPKNNIKTFSELKILFEKEHDDFTIFWYTHMMGDLQEAGLLIL